MEKNHIRFRNRMLSPHNDTSPSVITMYSSITAARRASRALQTSNGARVRTVDSASEFNRLARERGVTLGSGNEAPDGATIDGKTVRSRKRAASFQKTRASRGVQEGAA